MAAVPHPLPGATPRAERVPSTDGVTLAVLDLGGEGPPLLLCHPTGFHGMMWAPVAARLADVARCWAIDFRGHGDSDVPASGSFDWRGMADDVLAVAGRIAPAGGPVYGVGHSMGGAALFLAEERHPGTWAGLWCYEPIVFPRLDGLQPRTNPMANAARRRKAVFPDRATAARNYRSKPPLDAVEPEALEAYVGYGFRDLPDGRVELKCSPENEARTFEGSMSADVFAGLATVSCPTVVAASGDGHPPAVIAASVADALPNGRLARFPTLTHFGPLEDAAAIAAAIRAMLPAD